MFGENDWDDDVWGNYECVLRERWEIWFCGLCMCREYFVEFYFNEDGFC